MLSENKVSAVRTVAPWFRNVDTNFQACIAEWLIYAAEWLSSAPVEPPCTTQLFKLYRASDIPVTAGTCCAVTASVITRHSPHLISESRRSRL